MQVHRGFGQAVSRVRSDVQVCLHVSDRQITSFNGIYMNLPREDHDRDSAVAGNRVTGQITAESMLWRSQAPRAGRVSPRRALAMICSTLSQLQPPAAPASPSILLSISSWFLTTIFQHMQIDNEGKRAKFIRSDCGHGGEDG